jgi:hypothetical protein
MAVPGAQNNAVVGVTPTTGIGLTVIVKVLVLVEPQLSETTTVYTPSSSAVTLVNTGFCAVEANEFGPVHAYV